MSLQAALLNAVLARQAGGRGNVLAVRNCGYVAVCSAARGASAPTGRRGAGHIVAAAGLQLVIFWCMFFVFLGTK